MAVAGGRWRGKFNWSIFRKSGHRFSVRKCDHNKALAKRVRGPSFATRQKLPDSSPEDVLHESTPAVRCLILGATSFVGHFLALRLSPGGQPLGLSRSPPAGAPHIEWMAGDLRDPDLRARLPRISIVYSLAPIWLVPAALPAIIEAGASRVIAVSSTSRFTKIDSPIKAERRAVEQCISGEERLIAICERAGVTWTILRPTMIYAEGRDKNISRLAGLIRRFGVVPLLGLGDGLRQPVHADDLAAAAVAAASSAAAANRAYNLAGGETLTYRELVGRIFDGLQRPRRIVSLPPWLWRLMFSVARPVLPPGVNVAMGSRMVKDLTFDSEAARRDLNWNPRGFHPRF
jgi:nucleoside-diphosphate-sugar epimerase